MKEKDYMAVFWGEYTVLGIKLKVSLCFEIKMQDKTIVNDSYMKLCFDIKIKKKNIHRVRLLRGPIRNLS